MPIPPIRAITIAVSASVTVSIAADNSGVLSEMPRVRRVETSTSLGSVSL